MRRTLLRRASVALVLALAASAAAAVPAGARPDEPAGVLIAEPAYGRQAISVLGDRLAEAARVNSMAPAALRRLLADDRSATVDRRGKLFYRDPVRAVARETDAAVAPYPLDQTFQLNSLPGSQHTLFIDFDGAEVRDTFWNRDNGVTAGVKPAWSVDADATTFNDNERRLIQDIWLRVAEDYAPFDVNVTTQDPGDAAINRSGSSDPTYGTRALVTPDEQALDAICQGLCVGVAYLDVFADSASHRQYQPAWIFPHAYTDTSTGDVSTKGIAETISHEVGHNLALDHDGDATEAYYPGHGSWAPIMGNSDLKPITQWSQGEYAGANNKLDDFAVVAAAGAPVRADEAPGTITSAVTSPPAGPAYISSRTDRDVYGLGPCAGSVTVTAAPAPASPNLDVELALLDASGLVVATADPPSAMVNEDVASGLGASIEKSVPAGDYFVRVDGVGNGTASSGYTDYASVGSYQLTVSGCSTLATAPSAPTSVSATMDSASTATIRWAPPVSDGGSAVTGYDVSIDSGVWQPLGATARSHTFTAQSGDSHTLAVRAHNDVGTGASVSRTVSAVVAATAPDAPQIRKARNGARGGEATAKARWAAPASDGGSAVLGYQVVALKIRGGLVTKQKESRILPASSRAHEMRLRRGTWWFVVFAHNDIDWSRPSRLSNEVRAR